MGTTFFTQKLKFSVYSIEIDASHFINYVPTSDNKEGENKCLPHNFQQFELAIWILAIWT